VPSGTLPLATKRRGGKLVICNLQPTKHVSARRRFFVIYLLVVPKKGSAILGQSILN